MAGNLTANSLSAGETWEWVGSLLDTGERSLLVLLKRRPVLANWQAEIICRCPGNCSCEKCSTDGNRCDCADVIETAFPNTSNLSSYEWLNNLKTSLKSFLRYGSCVHIRDKSVHDEDRPICFSDTSRHTVTCSPVIDESDVKHSKTRLKCNAKSNTKNSEVNILKGRYYRNAEFSERGEILTSISENGKEMVLKNIQDGVSFNYRAVISTLQLAIALGKLEVLQEVLRCRKIDMKVDEPLAMAEHCSDLYISILHRNPNAFKTLTTMMCDSDCWRVYHSHQEVFTSFVLQNKLLKYVLAWQEIDCCEREQFVINCINKTLKSGNFKMSNNVLNAVLKHTSTRKLRASWIKEDIVIDLVLENKTAIIDRLLQAPGDLIHTMITKATFYDKTDLVKMISLRLTIDDVKKLSKTSPSLAIMATLNNSLGMLKMLQECRLIKTGSGYTNKLRLSTLDWANYLGFRECADYLQKAGVKEETEYCSFFSVIHTVYFSRMSSLYEDTESLTRRLVYNGCHPNSGHVCNRYGSNHSCSVLCHALWMKNGDFVLLLLRVGLDPLAVCREYLTPSFVAELLRANYDISPLFLRSFCVKFGFNALDFWTMDTVEFFLANCHSVHQNFTLVTYALENSEWPFINTFFSTPKSLAVMSRDSYRRHFGVHLRAAISKLELPKRIVDLLTLDTVIDNFVEKVDKTRYDARYPEGTQRFVNLF